MYANMYEWCEYVRMYGGSTTDVTCTFATVICVRCEREEKNNNNNTLKFCANERKLLQTQQMCQ